MTIEIEEAAIISRIGDVLEAEVAGEIALMSVTKGRYYLLNDVASNIWNRLSSPISMSELCAELIGAYRGVESTMAADVRTLLSEMESQSLVQISKPNP